MANIRTIDYKGFASASAGTGPKGWMLWSGSEDLSGSAYSGVGMELVAGSESYLKFDASSTGAELDIKAKKFFIGTPSTQYISGSSGNIEISSSLFHLDPTNNKLIIGAGTTINADLSVNSLFTPAGKNANTATAYIAANGDAGFIGDGSGSYTINFTPSGAKISGFEISASEIKSANNNLRLKSSGQITGSLVKFDGGTIGGWNIGTDKISNDGIHLSASYGVVAFSGSVPSSNLVELKYLADNNYGLIGKANGNTIFSLGANLISGVADNQIAGWEFTDTQLKGGKLVLDKTGKIFSEGFQSSPMPLGGTGFMLSVDDGNGASFLEVENARIRGTLSTAVFEKETVNAVGGQLIVANSTVLTSSNAHTSSLYTDTENTLSVVNVTGFSEGEILFAKKVGQTGFNTEYMLVQSMSRNSSSNENDFTGNIYVHRGYTGSGTANTSSLPGPVGGSTSYSGSQVLVSTGKVNTGFVHINANPNDPSTPYIDIVERTGSNLFDARKVARLGDLSGIEDTINGQAVSGYGLYTDNAFLKGGIVATYGSIGALDIGTSSISIGGTTYGSSGTKFFASSSGHFSLGDKFTWDGSGLSINGQITIGAGSTDNSGIADAAEAAASAAQSTANTATASAAAAQSTANTATASAAAAQSTANTATASAAAAQSAIDTMETQVVLDSTGMELRKVNGKKVAKYGTTTNFYDGSDSENIKLVVQAAGITAYGDDLNTYAQVTSTGLNIVEDSTNVANFGSSMRVGVDSTTKSALRVDSSGNLTIGPQGKTNISMSAATGDVAFEGLVSAVNFSEKFVVVNSGNVANYTASNGAGINLLFDGSGGGEITMNMQLNVDPGKIMDIIIPNAAASQSAEVQIVINANGCSYENEDISGGYATAAAQRQN